MLIDFKVQNFRSIGFEQEISFIASTDKEHQGHLIVPYEDASWNLLRSVLLFGPNASGKSNLCIALSAMRFIVTRSATAFNEGDELECIEPFRFNSRLEDEPTSFEVRVVLDEVIFRYGFEASKSEITKEWLFQTSTEPRSREVLLFDRFGQDKEKWKFGNSFKGAQRHLRERTRASNGLLLSKGAQESFEQLSPLFDWFHDRLKIVSMTKNLRGQLRDFDRACRSSKLSLEELTAFGQVADPGVVGTQRSQIYSSESDSQRIISRQEPEASIRLSRKQNDTDHEIQLDFSKESDGTRRFFLLTSLMVEALQQGKVLVIDEIESSLHPKLTKEILEVLHDPDLGGRAQFILATHDSNLFDFSKMRRDQFYLVEKGLDHQTDIYRLDDLKPIPKLDIAAEKNYLTDRFGGTPMLGNLRLAIASALAHGKDGGEIYKEE